MSKKKRKTSLESLQSQVDALKIAFRPVVNVHTGLCYGYDTALQPSEKRGSNALHAFFQQIHQDTVLQEITYAVYAKAVATYAAIPQEHAVKLFFSLDSRLYLSHNPSADVYREILRQHGISERLACFEISGHVPLSESKTRSEPDHRQFFDFLRRYRSHGFRLCVGHLGTGLSELLLFSSFVPDFVKIDRSFVQELGSDAGKKMLISNLINTAHTLGTRVIACGVESEQQFYACRDIGFELAQGDFIQPPVTDMSVLRSSYGQISGLVHADRRQTASDDHLIRTEMASLPTLAEHAELCEVFDLFREHNAQMFFPVTTPEGEPVGIVHENNLKRYTYHQYGRDLLRNRSANKSLKDFMTNVPVVDVHTSVEKILEIFSVNNEMEGILIVENMRYIGFLSARSLLNVLSEKNLSQAREQNPLTRLPGNMLIHEYMSHGLNQPDEAYGFVYFDLNHFKPFNDTYGFRFGDRALLMFADLLKVLAGQDAHYFIGHVGGDDFFMGARNLSIDLLEADVGALVRQFRRDVESLYDPQTIRKGYLRAKDREGRQKKFALLSVSAVILELPRGRPKYTTETVSHILADLKKIAKQSATGIHRANILTLSMC